MVAYRFNVQAWRLMKQPTIGDVLERTSLIDSCRQSEIPGIGIAARTFGMAIPDCIGNVTLLKPAVIIKRTLHYRVRMRYVSPDLPGLVFF